jgi:hypothetical protein
MKWSVPFARELRSSGHLVTDKFTKMSRADFHAMLQCDIDRAASALFA